MRKKKLLNKDFSIMVLGQFISLLGNSIQRFTLSLYILDLTGSAMIFSILVAVAFVPQILLSPFGGAIADRFSKKWIMVILDTISGLLLFCFFLFSASANKMSCFAIGILMFLMTIIQSIYDPSVRASLPAVTAPENLSAANSIVSIISSVTGLLGPVVAGFLYGILGLKFVFLINTISFFSSAIMELFLSIPHRKSRIEGNLLQIFISDIKNTLIYLYRDKPIIFQIIIISCSINLFLSPIYSVGMPFVEKIIFRVSNELYGISEGCVGAGMIIGALLARIVIKKLPFEKSHGYFFLITICIGGMSISALPFVLVPSDCCYLSYGIFTVCAFTFAFLLSVVNILTMTYMQEQIPMEYMGKSMALIVALSNALYPVGQLLLGWLFDLLASATWVIFALIGLIALLISFNMRSMIRKSLT